LDQPELFAAPEPARVFAPRPYQIEARDRAFEMLQTHRSTLIVKPTGVGKSATAALIIERVKAEGGRVLFTAPTITLTEQSYGVFRQMGLTVGIEQADNRVSFPLPNVTVGSVASMRGARLRRFPRDAFTHIIIDEAHRAPGGTAYREILGHFAHAKVIGLTATADRADGVAMGNVFESVAFEMTLLDAIKDGWLAPLEFRTVRTNWDPKQIKELAGEVNAGSVEKELVRSGLLHDAAATLAELGAGRKVLAFLPTVAAAKGFAAELSAKGLTSAHIDGETPPIMRQNIFRDFRNGKLDVLTNVAVLIEGFDQPDVSVVALLSPTKSRGRLTQMIGRGTRLAPGKASCLVLDFCPGRLRKGRLAAPVDALAGKMVDDDVYSALGDGGDLRQALADAEMTAEKLREAREKKEERARARKERIDALKREAKQRAYQYDQDHHSAGEILGSDGWNPERPADPSLAPRDGESDEDRRKRLKLCTPKQGALLKRKGLNPDLPFVLARLAIDAISKNNWVVPEHIRNDRRYLPKAAS
jgi:superfamily II DNA or RNA helicase